MFRHISDALAFQSIAWNEIESTYDAYEYSSFFSRIAIWTLAN